MVHALISVCTLLVSAQEASHDLKKILKEVTGQETPESKGKRKRIDEGTVSTTDTDRVKDNETQSSSMKALKDQDGSSNEAGGSPAEPEAEDRFSEESSDDEDLFQGPFAIKDKDQEDKAVLNMDVDRLTKLPPKLQPHVSSFQPELLDSIPSDVSENLGYIMLVSDFLA